MPLKTLHVATIGDGTEEVLLGIRSFPTHKLALVCLSEHRPKVANFAADIERTLKIPVDVYAINGDPIEGMLRTIMEIMRKDGREYEDIIINVGGGDKNLTCAATATAFINGLKAFHCMKNSCVMLPILKLSYTELVSKTKVEILRTIEKAGGEVESLERLKDLTGHGKPLLSYHVQGAADSRGLAELGLVDIERATRGRTRIRLTTLGRMLLQRQ